MRVEELQLLRNDDLLHLARNQSASCRADAIRLLVERGSALATHPDIATEAAALVYASPAILKKSDPASEHSARKLPGLIDVLARTVDDQRVLAQSHSALEGKHGQHVARVDGLETAHGKVLEELRGQIDSLRTDYRQRLGEAERRASVAEARIARMERSVWQKLREWLTWLS
jgi:hypothetical protein